MNSPGNIQFKGGSAVNAWQITAPGRPFNASYGFNGHLFEEFQTHLRGSTAVLGADTFSVKSKAGIPMLLDSAGPAETPTDHDRPPSDGSGSLPLGMMGFCINRHDTHVNGVFLDWSVRKIGLKELWTLKWYQEFNTAGHWTKAGGIKPEDWPKWMRGFKDY